MPAPDSAFTSAALLTPPGEGGISVIRLAGPDALSILREVFRASGGNIAGLDPSRIYYGTVVDETGGLLDEVIVHARGAIVDINCHGGVVVTRRVMARLIALGAREVDAPTPAGLDALQAEAWQALLGAATGLAAAIFLDQYEGALSRALVALVEGIEAGAKAEAASGLERLLETAQLGLRLVDPPRVVLAGRPNVGKSCLLNALVGGERALVHPAPGTTRDYLDALAVVEDFPLLLLDTAGVRAGGDALEEAGRERALAEVRRADLVAALFDGSEPLQPEDKALAQHLGCGAPALGGGSATHGGGCATIPVINKIDLPQRLSEKEVTQLVGSAPSRVSALTGEGLGGLGQRLVRHLFGPVPPPGSPVVFTPRQAQALRRARDLLERDPSAARMALKDLFS